MSDHSGRDADDLEAQDEVLQVMFWLRGERLADEVSPADIARFTGASPDAAARVLHRLLELQLVSRVDGPEPRFALTAAGRSEGGRRFADEFADYVKAGHGECNDPDCECRRTGQVEDCRGGN